MSTAQLEIIPVGRTVTKSTIVDLAAQEEIIRTEELSFVRKFLAFHVILENRLYRAHQRYSTADDYIREYWGKSPARVYQLITAAKLYEFLQEAGEKVLPLNEGQCRELARLPQEKRLGVWKAIIGRIGSGTVTALVVKRFVDKELGLPDVAKNLANAPQRLTFKPVAPVTGTPALTLPAPTPAASRNAPEREASVEDSNSSVSLECRFDAIWKPFWRETEALMGVAGEGAVYSLLDDRLPDAFWNHDTDDQDDSDPEEQSAPTIPAKVELIENSIVTTPTGGESERPVFGWSPQYWENPGTFKIPRVASEGERHNQLPSFGCELVRAGVSRENVEIILSAYQPALPRYEIQGIVGWACEKYGFNADTPAPENKVKVPAIPPEIAAAEKFGSMSLEELAAKSPVPIPEDAGEALILLLSTHYAEEENINVIVQFLQDDDLFKASPVGRGRIRTVSAWKNEVARGGIGSSNAGAWFRPNPVKIEGSGRDGAFKDEDIVSFRFLLIESDFLPQHLMVGLIAAIPLPVAVVYTTGGSSRQQGEQGVHALIKVDAPDAESYKRTAAAIMTSLKPYGIDQSNKNPSRLSRLPGAIRKIGGLDGGLQRLVYLNPNPTSTAIKS